MLGTGLIGLFYTRTLHGQRNRDRVHVVYSRSQERAEAFAQRERRARVVDRPRGGDRAPGDRHGHRRAAERPARGGRRALRAARQGGAVHEAARAHRRRRRSGSSTSSRAPAIFARLPRGPRLHAEDAEGGRGRAGRRDRRRHVGALARDASRPAQRVVLGREAGGRRRRSSTSAATASRSSATSSARTTGRSR